MKNIAKQLYAAYKKGGANAVYDLANKLGLPYHPCKQCAADTPTIETVAPACGVCGMLKRDVKLPVSTMYFKDEGGYYTYKLTKDGKVTDPNEMYEFGSLQTLSCQSQRMAKLIAKGRGLTAVFG